MVVRRSSRAPGTPLLPVPLVRARVERELSRISLRQAAREIGISPNALKSFVAGATPRWPTRLKLERWLTGLPPEQAAPALGRFLEAVGDLTRDLPSPDAAVVGLELSRLLLDAYRRRQLPPPRWVHELAQHYSAPSGGPQGESPGP